MRAIVLLAAGRSLRFGGQKLLAAYRARPLVSWAAEAGASAGAERRIAVLGEDAEPVWAALAPWSAAYQRVDNPSPEQGLAGSLRVGLDACADAAAAAILLADMPDIDAALIDRLFAALTGDAYAAVPAVAGRWGNPVVLSPAAMRAAKGLSGDRGARSLLEARAQDVAIVPVTGEGIYRDIDRPEDL
jgi:molybdenum cofactor cytidylyltransferase